MTANLPQKIAFWAMGACMAYLTWIDRKRG